MKIPFLRKKGHEKPLPYRAVDMFGTSAPERTDFLSAFEQVSWVNSCIRLIANNIADATLRLYQTGPVEVEAHPALQLLENPNQFMTKEDLFSLTVQQLELIGESFWLIISTKRGVPIGLVPLNPTRMTMRLSEGIPTFWEYEGAGAKTRLELGDVVFFRYPNPVNPWRGTSPLKATALAADIDLYASQWNRNFFYHSATPSALFTTDSRLTDEEYLRLKTMIEETYSGARNAHKALLLESGLDFKPLTSTHKDMDFLEMRRFTRVEIASAFGVPLSKLGISEEVNRATAYINDYTFARNTLTPKLSMIAAAITRWLLPAFKTEGLWFEFDSVIPQDTETMTNNLVSLVSAGILTPNEARVELGYEERPDFETQGGPAQAAKRAEIKKKAPPTREIYWKDLVKKADFKERNIKGWVANRFTQQERILKKNLRDLLEEGTELPKGIKAFEGYLQYLATKLTNFMLGDAEQSVWRDFYSQTFRKLMLDESDDFVAEFGLGVSLGQWDQRVEEIIPARAQRFARQINETTYKELQDALVYEMLQQGLNEESMVERIEEIMTLSRRQRAQTIARTELFSAINESHQITLEKAGVSQKEWMAALDERTRQAHADANGQQVNTDDVFDVGGEPLRFPGDPFGSADNIINCRCILAPVVEGW